VVEGAKTTEQMRKPKTYFIADNLFSMTETQIREYMREHGLIEISAAEAIPIKVDGMFYCKIHGVGDKSEQTCGAKWCSDYTLRNGKRGMCKHQGKLYEASETETIIKL